MLGSGETDRNPKYIASMLRGMERLDEANQVINDYIQAREETLALPNKDFAKELMDFGNTALYDTTEQAVIYYEKAIVIFEALPDSQGDLIKALNGLSDALCQLEKLDEARTRCRHALQLHEERDGALHWSLKEELGRLKVIEEKLENREEVERLELLLESLPEPDPVEEQDRWQLELDEMTSGIAESMAELIKGLSEITDEEVDDDDDEEVSTEQRVGLD